LSPSVISTIALSGVARRGEEAVAAGERRGVDRGRQPRLRDVAAGRIDADADATDQRDGRQRDQHGDGAAPVVGELVSGRE
jgi:hypothetical protein